jgi:hypothetical protein
MTEYIDHKISLEKLHTYQGYSLQVFSSGRIKLSFHITHTNRVEYYGERPKRHQEAYRRQAKRSGAALPQHFALIDQLLATCRYNLIFRLHLKADNNSTADNAHVIVDTNAGLCHVILDQMHHQWELPNGVIQRLLSRTGPRNGAASCFNEYMPSYDHDWCDAHFLLSEYSEGYREPKRRPQAAQHTTHDPDLNF